MAGAGRWLAFPRAPPNKLKSSEADEPDIPVTRLPTLVGWVTLLNHNYTRVPELELMLGSTEVNCVSHTDGPRAVPRASVKWIAARFSVFTENMSSTAAAAVVLQLTLAVFLLLDTSFAQGEISLNILICCTKGWNLSYDSHLVCNWLMKLIFKISGLCTWTSQVK